MLETQKWTGLCEWRKEPSEGLSYVSANENKRKDRPPREAPHKSEVNTQGAKQKGGKIVQAAPCIQKLFLLLSPLWPIFYFALLSP